MGTWSDADDRRPCLQHGLWYNISPMNDRLSYLGNRIWFPAIFPVHEPMVIYHHHTAGTAGFSADVRLDLAGGAGSQSQEEGA